MSVTRSSVLLLPAGAVAAAGLAAFGWWVNTYLLPMSDDVRDLERQVAVLEAKIEQKDSELLRMWALLDDLRRR